MLQCHEQIGHHVLRQGLLEGCPERLEIDLGVRRRREVPVGHPALEVRGELRPEHRPAACELCDDTRRLLNEVVELQPLLQIESADQDLGDLKVTLPVVFRGVVTSSTGTSNASSGAWIGEPTDQRLMLVFITSNCSPSPWIRSSGRTGLPVRLPASTAARMWMGRNPGGVARMT